MGRGGGRLAERGLEARVAGQTGGVPGALRYAPLGPGGLLAGSLVAPLGLGLTLW
jgi:hypothetical protein